MKTVRLLLSVNDMKSDVKVLIGRIVAPHGVRGDLRMFPDIDRPEVISSLEYLWIGGKKYRLMSCRPHKNIYILHVEGVEDRNQTELMRGMEVEVPASALPKRTDGTYYYHELLGLKVVTEEGEPVGILKEIIETKANNVYSVISEEGKETLIPAIPPCILHVDPAGGTMTVKLLEWE